MQPGGQEDHDLTLTVDEADDPDPATAPEDNADDADAPPSPSQVKASNDAEAIVDMFRGTISDCKEPQSHFATSTTVIVFQRPSSPRIAFPVATIVIVRALGNGAHTNARVGDDFTAPAT